ncbi:hypothetical protein D3C80_529360 [compost metagenome]
MATQGKEVVVQANLLALEQLLPDFGHGLFLGADRRPVHRLYAIQIRCRQGLAVKLAVGRQRHGRQKDQLRRHHVVWQAPAQLSLELIGQGLLAGLVGHGHSAIAGHHIGQQLHPRRALPGNDHALADSGLLLQARLDFTQFDAQATNLHLMIDAPGIFDHPILALTRQVAGAIQPLPTGERVGDEALGRQPRAAVIAASQAFATQVQLTDHPRRHRVEPGVEDKSTEVGNRLADRHAVVLLGLAGPVGDVDCRLGRPVEVVQFRLGQLGQHLLLDLQRQRFTTADDPLQAGAGGGLAIEHERLQHRRNEMHGGDPGLANQPGQAGRITVIPRLGHDQARAAHQRPEKLPHRYIETERGLLQDGVTGIEAVRLLHPVQAVAQGPMAVGSPFRPAGRTRGVDHVRQVLAIVDDVQITLRLACQVQLIDRQGMHSRRQWQPRHQGSTGQHQADGAVFDHVRQAFAGILRIQRYISAAGLEHREQGNHHLHAAFEGDPDQLIGTDTGTDQPPRQLVGPGVELRITERLAGKLQRRRLRCTPHLGLDQAMDAHLLRIVDAGRIPITGDALALVCIEHAQFTNHLLWVGNDGAQQIAPVAGHFFCAGGTEQIGRIGQCRRQALGVLFGGQRQVDLGRAGLPRQGLHLQTQPVVAWRRALKRTALVVEHGLEQRVVTE